MPIYNEYYSYRKQASKPTGYKPKLGIAVHGDKCGNVVLFLKFENAISPSSKVTRKSFTALLSFSLKGPVP